MSSTITIDWNGVHVVLGRSTVADARLRRQLYSLIPKERQNVDASNYCFFITQLRECSGLPFKQVTTLPDLGSLVTDLDNWDNLDEMLVEKITDDLKAMREDTGEGEKKVSTNSPSGT